MKYLSDRCDTGKLDECHIGVLPSLLSDNKFRRFESTTINIGTNRVSGVAGDDIHTPLKLQCEQATGGNYILLHDEI